MSAVEVWKGSKVLAGLLVPLDSLELHPQNPRQGDVEQIAVSLERFGQVRPVLVDDAHRVVAGNHTTLAARSLGWTHIAAIPNTFESETEARAYLLADNRLPELGEYENEQLLALLEEIEASGQWEGTGYESDHLEDLRAELARVPETAREDFKGDHADAGDLAEERARSIAGQEPMREVVLVVTEQQKQQFDKHVGIIQRERGLTGVAEAVYAAIDAQATQP